MILVSAHVPLEMEPTACVGFLQFDLAHLSQV